MRRRFPTFWVLTLWLISALASTGAHADPLESSADPPPFAPGVGQRSAGRPSVRLDRLVFPSSLPRSSALQRHFRYMLKRAARRADWGAGRGAKIEYRVIVEELSAVEKDGVLRVKCTALGRLPRGKSARSHVDFGGDPKRRRQVVVHVLEIVARGVVTRLAAIERERRRAARKG